jgi:hypothetical protein
MVLPLVAGVLLGASAPWLGRRLPPATAVLARAAARRELPAMGAALAGADSAVADCALLTARLSGKGCWPA